MAGIKLTLRIKGQDSERRTATAHNAAHLKDICRRWLAGYSDRGIRAEYTLLMKLHEEGLLADAAEAGCLPTQLS